ncbi:penicillin acylase family protein [Yunchengibacter salinarum]|uniref:penicillin acylase family protein n=1 Tax=Yunchengibacter salinarum TaxID=3133399 RepID=UPI0035B61C8A
MRWVWRLLIGALLVSGLVLFWAWVTLPTGADPARYATLADRYDGEIIRDDFGVPHIYGPRDEDVVFGLALAHAQDDVETIEDVILASRGRLAAKKGLEAAKTDYLVGWMDVQGAVSRGYDSALSPRGRALARAYADGINYFASQQPGRISRQLLPVTGRDVVAGFTFKAPFFWGFDKVVAAVAEGRAKAAEQPPRAGPGLDGAPTRAARSFLAPAARHAPFGSQGIAVAPVKSSDGHVRLLINSHQPLTGPVAWYEARLKSDEGIDMVGGTFPGAPLILHGHGPTLGWANTVNRPDLVDIYKLTMNPDNDREYLHDGHWVPLDVRSVPITVKLWGPLRWTVQRKVEESVHGPVFRTETGVYAVRWVGRNEVRHLDFLLRLNTARSFFDFQQAFQLQAFASLNFIYADRNGHIAHFYNAKLPDRPVRHGGRTVDWRAVLPGDSPDLVWDSYHPFDLVPMTIDPPRGFVFNANNDPFLSTDGPFQPDPADYTPDLGIERGITNRARRILTRMTGEPQISADEFRALKYDKTYAPDSRVARLVARVADRPLPEHLADDPDRRQAQHLLQAWDRRVTQDSRAAALAVLTVNAFVHGDGAVTDDALHAAFDGAVSALLAHHGRVDPAWGEIVRIRRGDQSWSTGGGPDVPRALYADGLDADGQYTAQAGDSYILFVDWDETGQVLSRAVHNFGAATSRPESPHFDDQVGLFVQERTRMVKWRRAVLDRHAESRQAF